MANTLVPGQRVLVDRMVYRYRSRASRRHHRLPPPRAAPRRAHQARRRDCPATCCRCATGTSSSTACGSNESFVDKVDGVTEPTDPADPYASSQPDAPWSLAQPFRVPAGHYFVMGDNRTDSSRQPLLGHRAAPRDHRAGVLHLLAARPHRRPLTRPLRRARAAAACGRRRRPSVPPLRAGPPAPSPRPPDLGAPTSGRRGGAAPIGGAVSVSAAWPSRALPAPRAHGTMASTVSILRAKNGRERLEKAQNRTMPTTPGAGRPRRGRTAARRRTTRSPRPSWPGTRGCRTTPPGPRAACSPPTSGNTPQQQDRLPALEDVVPVEQRHGEAVDAVVEGDRDAQRGDRVGQHVLTEQRQPHVPARSRATP